jgi:hypothetical protein
VKRILAFVIWIVINVLPDWLSMWLLDLSIPDWVERARKAKKKGSSRGDTE